MLRPHLERLLSFEPYEQSGYLSSEHDPRSEPQRSTSTPITYGLTVGV